MAETILIVDDHDESRELMTGMFEEEGYGVEEARDGQEAVCKAQSMRPDLILLDVRMPRLTGYEACQILQAEERTRDIPVIFLSAMGGSRDKIRGLEIGGVDYITKPFDREEVLARVALQLKVRRLSREILAANQSLREKEARLEEDLRAAAGIQQSLLPQKAPAMDELAMAWKFLPSDMISGDIFNLIRMDDHTLALYMVDVSGHGVPSALVTVSVSQALQPRAEGVRRPARHPGARVRRPRQVLAFLDRDYPIERFGKLFTIVYALLDVRTGELVYSSAGHPPPVLLRAAGGLELLDKGGPMIGLQAGIPFAEERVALRAGDVLILYTDGVVELQNDEGAFYGMERFGGLLAGAGKRPVGAILDAVIADLAAFRGGSRLQDDVSLLGVEFKGACR